MSSDRREFFAVPRRINRARRTDTPAYPPAWRNRHDSLLRQIKYGCRAGARRRPARGDRLRCPYWHPASSSPECNSRDRRNEENRLLFRRRPSRGSVQTASLSTRRSRLIAVDSPVDSSTRVNRRRGKCQSLAYHPYGDHSCGHWLDRHCESDP